MLAFKLITLVIFNINYVFSEEKRSLTFVIDHTISMQNDINQVLSRANDIFDTVMKSNRSQIENFVLVTFNDPSFRYVYECTDGQEETITDYDENQSNGKPLTRRYCNSDFKGDTKLLNITKDRSEFKNALSSIKVQGGGDCPEYSMSGIEMALENSLPGSYLFVFTDGSAKDYAQFEKVKNLAMTKRSQIVFVLTDKCLPEETGIKDNRDFTVYQDLAKATSGKVFEMYKDDVNEFFKYVMYNIEHPPTLIAEKEFPPGYGHEFTITFDIDHKDVLVSVTGTKPKVYVKAPDGTELKTESMMTGDNMILVKIIDVKPDTYTIGVGSQSNTSVQVLAKSTIQFKYGFSTFWPSSFNDVTSRPLPDVPSHICVQMIEGNLELTKVKVLSMDDEVIEEVPLYVLNETSRLYATNLTNLPSGMFRISIAGHVREFNVTRSGQSPVAPQPLLTHPKVTIPSKKINVLETSDATIYCRIREGVPRPVLSWQFKKNGDKSEWQPLSGGQEELLLKSVTLDNAGIYKCIASNKVGTDTIRTELEVLKAPKVYTNHSQITAQYGSNQELECTIVAHPPPTVTWTDDQGHELFTEIAKGNKFTSRLKVTNLRKDGSYFCNAVNHIDKAKIGFNILVERPLVIGSQFDAITKVPYGKEVKLKCDISSKLPIQRRWILSRSNELHKTKDRFTISPDGTELTVHFMEIDLQGTYGCKVWLKSDHKVFEQKITKIEINDLASPEIISLNDFWNNNTFTAVCSVKGKPKPSITWQYAKERDGKYYDLDTTGDKLVIENIESKHSGFYKCIAANEIEKANKILKVVVEEPPKITYSKTVYIGVVGDKELVIPCNVTGTPAPTITWKNNKNQIISTDSNSKYNIKENKLYILNPTIKDSNKFTCVAENKKGKVEKTFEASITDNLENEPSLYGETQKIYLLLNESKDLYCTIPGKPEEIKWYKNGLLTDAIGVNYRIKKAITLHDVKYTCRVNSVSQTYLVDVGYKPTFTNKYKTYNWLGGRDEYIDCFVKSKPEAKIEWTYNNQKKNFQDFDYVVDGWGEYKCRVSNVHGTIEKTIVVTTEGCLISRRFDYKKNTPLITSINLDVDYDDPLITGSELMFIKTGQRLGISCHTAGKNNKFKTLPEKDYLKIECLQEDLFTVNENVYKYSDLICKEAVVPTLINTGTKCANPTGEIIEVEFKADVPTESYKVCYDKKLNVPLFASSELSSYNIGNEVDSYKWTPMTGFSGGITDEACNETSKCCYKRSQLVNAVDVAAGPPQAATFNEINAVTVWQPCEDEKRMSWQTLEGNVRSLLQNKTEINVWSGASEYEAQNIGLVSRYLWKVLKINDNLTVIVHVNKKIPTKADIKCSKTIKDNKYANQLLRSGDQYTYLCDPEEFSNVFGIPLDTFY